MPCRQLESILPGTVNNVFYGKTNFDKIKHLKTNRDSILYQYNTK